MRGVKQDVRMSAPFLRRFLLCFAAAFLLVFPPLMFFHCVLAACLLLVKLFIMDPPNGSSTKTSAASFPVPDSGFTPALTFEVLSFYSTGEAPRRGALAFILALWC